MALNLLPSELPNSYPTPAAEVLQTLHVAWTVLETAQRQPDRLLTFQEVGLSPGQLSELLGVVWVRAYGQHAVPTIMPRVMVTYLFLALRHLAAVFADRSEDDKGLVAQAAKVVLENPEAKRVRVTPY